MIGYYRTTMFTDEEVSAAVKNGVSWLDENHPGWESKIDLSKLEMNQCNSCIIGQAVGDYYNTIAFGAGVDDDADVWAAAHGFCAPSFYKDTDGFDFDFDRERSYYRDLEVAWANEVNSRLK